MDVLPQLLLIVVLVLLNGYFVASEFALVAVRKTRIDELVRKKNRAAKLVQVAIEDMDTYISATQLGITIASLALGWVGEPVVARLIEPFFSFLPREGAFFTSHVLAFIIAFIIITVLHIVFGEVAPKSLALRRSEKTALFVTAPLIAFTKLFKPFIWFLHTAGNVVLQVFGIEAQGGIQAAHSEEEIKMILAQSGEEGMLEKAEIEMVYNVFKLGDIPVKQIMIPRTDVIAFNVALTLKEVIKRIKRYGHSRYPVYENSIDNIMGFIHVKDVYPEVGKSKKDPKLSELGIIRDIIHVPETKRADDVLIDMRNKRIHLAVVNDEYGGTAGLITLEDIVESVVGEIGDEFDKPLKEIRKESDGSFLVEGLVPIEKVQSKFNLALRGQGYTTIGGLVFGLLGREPNVGDEVQLGNIVFRVEKLDRKRIKTLRLTKERRRSTK